jgi:DNA-binding MarR family transcriptional regulator
MSTAVSSLVRPDTPGQSLAAWMNTLIDYVQSARPDLTNRQMALLMVVYLLPGPHTVRGLAARLRVAKPVVTRALNTLGSLGYVRRQKDAVDRRNIFIEQTPPGLAFLNEFAELVERTEGHDDADQGQRERRRTPH